MNRSIPFILIFIVSSVFADCQSPVFKPSFSVAFDSVYGPALLGQCSRCVPKGINGFWTTTSTDMQALENYFRNIDSLTTKEQQCGVINASISRLERYAFQYIGVMINGRRFIYINAFPANEVEDLKKNHADPSKYPLIMRDGGDYYWGALFDIETNQFSDLAFNGNA